MLFQSLKMAWSSILSNKMRSFLTMLGIIIGVMALIVLVSVVDGATDEITDVVSSLGPNLISVQIIDDKGKPLRFSDLEGMREQFSDLSEIAPSASNIMNIRCGREEDRAQVVGTTPSYSVIEGQKVKYGRNLNGADISNHLYVAVINSATAKDIIRAADTADAIGREFYLGGIPFRVIGIFEDNQSQEMFSISSYTANIPYTTLARMTSGTGEIRQFMASAVSDDRITSLEQEVSEWLMHRFDDDENSFTVINMTSVLSAMDKIMSTMTAMLGCIAAISLVVGGIGIMNIMLVSVTERTREIGIRKAIGAGYGSILAQFLIEALMLSLMGCLLGVLISQMILTLINTVSGHHFIMKPAVVTLSTVFSMIIGVIFGIYPARKAARKKPIDALHYGG